jgi:DNA polymerase-3 subunit epsilon
MMRLTIIDFETANNYPESACSIGFVVFEEGVILHEGIHLIKPADQFGYFEPFNISIHGITPQDVENALNFEELWPILLPWFRDSILVAHNAMFDMGVLNALIKLYGISKPLVTYLDTVEIGRKMWPYLPNHRLNTVCEFLEIELNHHEALSDARGSALILMNAMAQTDDFDIGSFINRLKLKEKAL